MTLKPEVLVTGGAGFIGANIADRLAGQGHTVRVYDALARPGVEANLEWLQARHGSRIVPIVADVRDRTSLGKAVAGASAIFHMAAQVAVTTSLDEPDLDFEVNLRGTLNLLESVRMSKSRPAIVFASTNKVYGALADIRLARDGDAYLPEEQALRDHGIDENRPLDFYTPYGCSKGAADQYVLDYARSYGVASCVLRMSCIYGPRQRGTEDQGWLAHFLYSVLAGRPISIYGDGRQVRDVLYVDDAVDAYLSAWENMDQVAGQAFNLGGGPGNAVTLLQVLAEIGEITGRTPDLHFSEWRPGDQRYFVADARRATAALGLRPPRAWQDGLRRLVDWVQSEALQPAMAAGA